VPLTVGGPARDDRRCGVVARIADVVAVDVGLIGIRRRRAIVDRVGHAVGIRVERQIAHAVNPGLDTPLNWFGQIREEVVSRQRLDRVHGG